VGTVTRGQGRTLTQRRPETGKLAGALGKAVIAMTAVRIGALVQSGKVTDTSNISPPTDVMVITSLPHTPTNHPVSGFPLGGHPFPPPATRGRHLPPENGHLTLTLLLYLCTFAPMHSFLRHLSSLISPLTCR
jgi:hypothetical protein